MAKNNAFQDTIVAVATPPGHGGVAIVRLSGSQARSIAETLFVKPSGERFTDWPSHLLRYGRLIDAKTGETVDKGMAVRTLRSVAHLATNPTDAPQLIRLSRQVSVARAALTQFLDKIVAA